MNDLDDLDIFNLRRKLYEELNKICKYKWQPEAKDFEVVKNELLSHIAYKLWEKTGKPKGNDVNAWLEAEQIWNFIRYMWV